MKGFVEQPLAERLTMPLPLCIANKGGSSKPGHEVGNVPGKLSPYSNQEARDYYDAIEWAARPPWSDGNVGLYGASYNATTQWHVAALHPPLLKAMAPISADGDIRDLAYPGGIFLFDSEMDGSYK
ncbi:X-Pro dipeptidyl-peptidase C-terminal non-catalytic domain-containing protein [Trichoderma harzianum]|uniref:X-Pro dipeptidyl-peptidase C-terminal non-catalytic domain-containing protein n=1 Tax=Trichoderma harzianum TaxID=5544 RepID=A0A0F9X5D2_TRIHA|nr:X-Pro dipeptidyl-peptidase C-terminal non-catalytic domain-containing protein [Trichoderma harzianum]